MSMRLTAEDLEAITAVVTALNGINFEVKHISVANHDVYVEKQDDGSYVVRGITDKTGPSMPVMRDIGKSTRSSPINR